MLNLRAMYFLYGLSFYTMGIAIAFQYRSYSSFRLAYSLRLLAAFGLLHGLSEWGSVFIPVQAPYLDLISIWKAVALQRLLQSVSLFFLFCFGTKLIFDSRHRNYWWFTLPVTAFASWLIQFGFFVPLLGTTVLAHWLLISESWARYLLALPAGLITAYGLFLQIPEVKRMNKKSVLDLYIAVASFVLFALSSGLVVPEKVGWLSKIINVQTFREYVGLPIEAFRTATAFMATWSISRILTIFDLEKQRQITESRRVEAVYRERERFARDLHDDVIQSVYGVGLELQTTIPLIGTDEKGAVQRVNAAVKRLNEVIHGLRTYIQGLETPDPEYDLQTWLVDTVERFREQTGLEVELNFQLNGYALNQVIGVEGWQRQVKQIVREALTNVVQHAGASKAQVNVQVKADHLIVTVKDNGKGIGEILDSSRKHLGLRNMRMRARLLGGDFQLLSGKGAGTSLIIEIPFFYEAKPAVKGEPGYGEQN